MLRFSFNVIGYVIVCYFFELNWHDHKVRTAYQKLKALAAYLIILTVFDCFGNTLELIDYYNLYEEFLWSWSRGCIYLVLGTLMLVFVFILYLLSWLYSKTEKSEALYKNMNHFVTTLKCELNLPVSEVQYVIRENRTILVLRSTIGNFLKAEDAYEFMKKYEDAIEKKNMDVSVNNWEGCSEVVIEERLEIGRKLRRYESLFFLVHQDGNVWV